MLKIVTLFTLLITQSLFAQPDEMIRDSTGNIISPNAPGTTITLDVKVYVDMYWSPRDGFMKNNLSQFTPKKPKDLFGFSNLVQTKWWPMSSGFELSSIPGDFISWVYVEMRTADYNISYSLPGYLDRYGKIRDVSGGMFEITVGANRDYFLTVHAFNGNSIVAAVNGTALKAFPVTTANTIQWDFTEDWTRALMHIAQISLPMIELPSLNGTTVWAIPSGDVPDPGISTGDRMPAWDNFIDYSDLRSIELSFGVKAGFSPYDLNLDKYINVDDWLYVNDNTLFFISGNPFNYKVRRR